VHDERHPFVVRTARGTVRDVGTTFAVRAYGDDAEHLVAVAEGEVSVGATVLTARDVATIGEGGRVAVRRGVDVARYLDWAQGRLVFDGTPLADAARELSRAYNLDVRIADSTLSRKLVTASFTSESVDEVLDVVTNIVGARYDRNGRTVVIQRGSVPAGHRDGRGRAAERIAAARARQ
jgi:transmembrane sensor